MEAEGFYSARVKVVHQQLKGDTPWPKKEILPEEREF